MRRPSSPAAIIEKYVADCRKKFPERNAAIDAFLEPYRLSDGGRQNDDNIMHGLRRLMEGWRKRRGGGGGRRSSRR